MKPRLVVIGPLPPPVHGVSISTSLVIANPYLAETFDVEHFDTSDHREGVELGRWDATNIRLALGHVWSFARRTRGVHGVVYLPLSQSVGGVVRDLLLIDTAAISGWRVAAHLRGSEFRDFYGRCPRPMRAWIRASLRRVSSVAVVGSRLRGIFDGLIPGDRIAVVPNGTPDFGSERISHDPRTVLFLSNLRSRKGVAEAVDAACLVLDRDVDARFFFVGQWSEPALERRLRERAWRYGSRIQFRPPVTGRAKAELFASAGIFLFPPVEPEGHPRVVLEALSAGLPVITTDRGAISETVVNGVNGFVLPEPAPPALASRVVDLLENHDRWEAMSRAARATYVERFTQENADRRLANWLTKVATMATQMLGRPM